MTCKITQQGDELFCSACSLRWSIDEDRPPCLLPGPVAESVQLRIAKCIIGPRLDVWIGREKLLEVRNHKWDKMVTRAERDDALNAAAAIMKELDIE